MSIVVRGGDEVGALKDAEGLRRVRETVVRRLEALEQERAQLAAGGHPEKARVVLRAFQEIALVLEAIDEIRRH